MENETHQKIIGFLMKNGPSLPIQISKEIGLSSLFISAFLSELTNEKKVKASHLKVGGSPLYFLQGQEKMLEPYTKYLHPKETEAFLLLKDRGILRDSEQKPAIRVALRNIRDFAMGFKKEGEIFWRFFSAPENEIMEMLEPKKEAVVREEIKQETAKSPEKAAEPEKQIRKKITTELFLEEVKSDLKKKEIELISIEHQDKKEIIAKIRFNLAPEKTCLLFAYNKKKIGDKEILKSYKKSLQYGLDYIVLFKGEISKKLRETINAHKRLINAEKMEAHKV